MMHKKNQKYSRLQKFMPVRLLIVFYLAAVVFSTLLLLLPIAYKDDVTIDFIDIIFTAVSALSVTGLSTISIIDTFNTTGMMLITIILHLGAVGVMAISTLVWLVIGKKIGLKERRLIMADQNQTSFRGMVRLIKEIIILLLVVEGIAFIILGTYYLKYFASPGEAFFNGYFTAISAISNAGFDLTNQSMIPYASDYFIQSIVMFLIIFGAIGFPVLIELKAFVLRKRQNREIHRFSLFFKVTTVTFFALVIIGAIGIYLLDMQSFFRTANWHETLFYALFQSVTTRSGGLSTLDVSQLTEANQLFISFLMFIGASPSSAGGGIRTTTFALVLLFLITYVRGRHQVQLFNREIHEEDLSKALAVVLVAFTFMFISVLLISIVETFSLPQILFEVTSAFGTVGLSLGITEQLTSFSKIILMLLMFIGRVGIITFLFMFRPKKDQANFHYPKERINIG